MLRLNTEKSKPLENSTLSPTLAVTLYSLQILLLVGYSMVMLKHLLSILELYIAVDIIYTHYVQQNRVYLRVYTQQKQRFCTAV